MKRILVCLLIAVSFVCGTHRPNAQSDYRSGRARSCNDRSAINAVVLQSPEVETLGITIVSGDQWRDEEVAHTLRMLELTGHPNIKVYPGAVFPLINSKEEIKRWEKLYGKVSYQGAWNQKAFVRTRAA